MRRRRTARGAASSRRRGASRRAAARARRSGTGGGRPGFGGFTARWATIWKIDVMPFSTVRRFVARFGGQQLEVALEATTGWRFARTPSTHSRPPAQSGCESRGPSGHVRADRGCARARSRTPAACRAAASRDIVLFSLSSSSTSPSNRRPGESVAGCHSPCKGSATNAALRACILVTVLSRVDQCSTPRRGEEQGSLPVVKGYTTTDLSGWLAGHLGLD